MDKLDCPPPSGLHQRMTIGGRRKRKGLRGEPAHNPTNGSTPPPEGRAIRNALGDAVGEHRRGLGGPEEGLGPPRGRRQSRAGKKAVANRSPSGVEQISDLGPGKLPRGIHWFFFSLLPACATELCNHRIGSPPLSGLKKGGDEGPFGNEPVGVWAGRGVRPPRCCVE